MLFFNQFRIPNHKGGRMVSSLFKEFSKEKVILIESSKASRLPFRLEGVVRLVDKKGRMLAMVLDRQVWAEFLEQFEYSDPKFWEEIESSRKSGRVSAKAIERRLGLK